jgi:hypothetical protein
MKGREVARIMGRRAKEAVHEKARKFAPWVKRVREFEDLYINNKVKTFDTFSSPIYLPQIPAIFLGPFSFLPPSSPPFPSQYSLRHTGSRRSSTRLLAFPLFLLHTFYEPKNLRRRPMRISFHFPPVAEGGVRPIFGSSVPLEALHVLPSLTLLFCPRPHTSGSAVAAAAAGASPCHLTGPCSRGRDGCRASLLATSSPPAAPRLPPFHGGPPWRLPSSSPLLSRGPAFSSFIYNKPRDMGPLPTHLPTTLQAHHFLSLIHN